MKILIIEDNVRLAVRMQDMLGGAYIIDVVHTGEDGVGQAMSVDYQLIILDLHLPDMPGAGVCKLLRQHKIRTPILILTAEDAITSKVLLLDQGADDYVTKPFSSAELHARIGALVRRRDRAAPNELLAVNDLEIDIDSRKVCRAGVPIPLRRKEFDILEYLVSNKGRTVSREMIMDHAWAEGAENWNNTIDVHIKHLRDKVDRPFSTPLIKTAYGVGYMVDG